MKTKHFVILILVAIAFFFDEQLYDEQIVSFGFRFLPYFLGLALTILIHNRKLILKPINLLHFLVYGVSISLVFCFVNRSGKGNKYSETFMIKNYHFKLNNKEEDQPRVTFNFIDEDEMLKFYIGRDPEKRGLSREEFMDSKVSVGLHYQEGLLNGYIIHEKSLLEKNQLDEWYDSQIKK